MPAEIGDETLSYQLLVNDHAYEVVDAWIGESLLYVLRERLGLLGTKNACEQGECGSCSVLVDGVLMVACCIAGADAVESQIVTIEGLAPPGELTDVQRQFLDHGAIQCGFCTPGLVMTIHALLDSSPDADELETREALSGNLCRCTGYGRVFAAVRAVQQERAGARG